jgi:hypothetical protein
LECGEEGGKNQNVKYKISYRKITPFNIADCQVIEWDWWELHSAEWATDRGWRFLIRVTETDYIKPRENLNDILRYQSMVFVKSDEVGW